MYKVLNKQTHKLLDNWIKLRKKLETSTCPLETVSSFFENLPKTKYQNDPYDQSSWPTPWELIEENSYCKLTILLGICYTLQMCEKFSEIKPKIQITIDIDTKNMYYILCIGSMLYGYEDNQWIHKNQLPKSLKNLKIYHMPSI